MARTTRQTQANECRKCDTFCDRVIKPSSCVASGCSALYEYDDPLSGRRFMGCLHKVFSVEIDVELFAEAERTRAGFGAVKLAAAPREQCRFQIEQAFTAYGENKRCVNRRFFDWPDTAPDAVKAFDLRDHC
jgi:hypothetical protein